MPRRQPRRPKLLAAVMTGECANGHRHLRRPIACRADRRDRLTGQRGHDRKAVDVGQLSLIGRHAERRVAFEMFDRTETLALGKSDVVRGHVILKIDERLVAADMPEWRHREGLVVGSGGRNGAGRETGVRGRNASRLGAFNKTIVQPHPAVRRADDG